MSKTYYNIYKDSSGNVGIGTTTPGSTLEIARGSGTSTAKLNGTTYSSHFNYATDEHTYIRGGKATSKVYINDSHSADVLIASGGGSVGIGTSSASTRLEINGILTIDTDWQPSQAVDGLALGDYNTGGYKWIQSLDSHPLSINPLGNNVGIGTSSPSALLNVAGNTFIGTSGSAYTGTDVVSLTINGVYPTLALGYTSNRFAITSYASYTNYETTGSAPHSFNGGSVGIGTTSPREKLNIEAGNFVFTGSHTGDADIQSIIWHNTNSTGFDVAKIVGKTGTNIYEGIIRFETKDSGGTMAERMRIASNGNVGIGTTDPSLAKLHISGSGSTQRALLAVQSTNNHAELSIISEASTYSSYIKFQDNSGAADRYLIQADVNDNLLFRPQGTGTTGNQIIFDDSGQLGVGCTPSYKIHTTSGSRFFGGDGYTQVERNTTSTGVSALLVQKTTTGGIATFYHSATAGTPASGTATFHVNSSDSYLISNLGIGTTSPAYKLDVSGDASFNGSGSSGYVYIRGNSGLGGATTPQYKSGMIFGWNRSNGYGESNIIFTDAGAGSNVRLAIQFWDNSTLYDYVSVNSSGNVGIGSTGPINRLQVVPSTSGGSSSNASEDAAYFGGNELGGVGGYTGIRLGGFGTSGYGTYIRSVKTTSYGNYWNEAITFSVTRTNTSSTVDEVMRITSGGNVGIGTTTPDTWSIGNHLYLTAQSGTGKLAIFNLVADGTNGSYIQLGNTSIRRASIHAINGSHLEFSVNNSNSGTNLNPAMRIQNDGCVGIGTSSPTRTLHVSNSTYLQLKLQSVGSAAGIEFISSTGNAFEIQSYASNLFVYDRTNSATRFLIKSTGQIQFNTYGSGTFTGTTAKVLAVDSSGNVIETNAGSGSVTSSAATTNYVAKWTNGGSEIIGNSIIYDNGSGIGINTTTISTEANVGGALSFQPGGAAWNPDNSRPQLKREANGELRISSGKDSASHITFHTNTTNLVSSTEKVRIQNDGNVGIGTVSPDASLHIIGKQMITTGANASPASTDYLYIGGDGLGSSDAAIYIGNRGNGTGYGWRLYYYGTGSGNDNKLHIRSENVGSPVDAMTFLQDGNIGINTSSPSDAIHIIKTLDSGMGLTIDNPSTGTGGHARIALINDSDQAFYIVNHGSGRTITRYGLTVANRSEIIAQESTNGLLIGTGSANNPIVFGNYDTERMRIAAGGNVGIGTTSPSEKLHVNATTTRLNQFYNNSFKSTLGTGTTYIGSCVLFGNGDGGGFKVTLYDGMQKVWRVIHVAVKNASGVNSIGYSVEGGGINSAAINVTLDYVNRSGSASTTDFFLTGTSKSYTQAYYCEGFIRQTTGYSTTGTTAIDLDSDIGLFTDSNDNIGIGTTSPSYKLDVVGDGHFSGAVYGGNLVIAPSGATNTIRDIDGNGTFIGYGSSSTDRVVRLGASGSELVVLNNGNIGIGNTSPTRDLHIGTTASTSTATPKGMSLGGTYSNSAGSNPKLEVWGNGSAYMGFGVSSNTLEYLLSQTSYKHVFYAAGSPLMTILGTGNVGIGTTNPTQKLHVVGGNVRLDSTNSYYVGNGSSYFTQYSTTGGKLGRIVEISMDNGVAAWDGSAYHGIASTGNTGSVTDSISINSYNDITLRLDSNNNNSASYLRIMNNTTGSADIAYLGFDGTQTVAKLPSYVAVNATPQTSYNLYVNGSFGATTKSFIIDHPTKPNKKLRYGSLEGPENGVYVRGRGDSDIIELPDYWTGLVHEDSITVQITAKGKDENNKIRKYSVNDIVDNKVYIYTDSGDNIYSYFYIVHAERKDVDKLQVEIDK